MNARLSFVPKFPKHQQGIATILILLLVGLAVTVTVLVAVYSLRSTQQRQLTTHATTAAQGAAWRGVEVIRTALLSVPEDRLESWADGEGWDKLDPGLVIPTSGAASGVGGTGNDSSSTGGSGSLPAEAEKKWSDMPKCGAAGDAKGVIAINGGDSLGVSAAKLTGVCRTAVEGSYQVTAEVTGRSAGAAGVDSAATTSTVEVIYDLSPASEGSTEIGAQVCGAIVPAALVFNGDLDYTGGKLDIENLAQDMENIAVNGNISVGSGATAKVSGCAKGDIALSGGGIADSAKLYAEGSITVNSMSPPVKADFWAKNISIGNTGKGTYDWIRAGGFQANLLAGNGALLGTTIIGGNKRSDGIIVPPTGGTIVVTLGGGTVYLLDLAKVSVSELGVITINGGTTRLEGQAQMPSGFRFSHVADYGGDVTVHQLEVDTLWGNRVQIALDGGTYKKTWAYGDLSVLRKSNLGSVLGGGNLNLTGDFSPSNIPVVTKGHIAGVINPSVNISNLETLVSGASPGLPGIPYCDARVNAVDVSSLRGQANYIFYFDPTSGAPMLEVQNVQRSDTGEAIAAGPYNLKTQDMRQLFGFDFLQCGWYNSHCARDANIANGWDFTGIHRFPAGVMYFEGPVTLNNATVSTLYNSILSTGAVKLGNASVTLSAPNLSTPAQICDGNFYPSNLCDKSASTSKFVTWTDQEGKSHTGLPIGNTAILTDKGLTASQWTVRGNVILGEQVQTSGAVLSVSGTVTVGSNTPGSKTTVGAGGFQIKVPVSADQIYSPICEVPAIPTQPTTQSASVRWSRYL